MTIAVIAGAWVQPHYGKWQARLMGAALLVSMLGVFMSATRVNALILFALVMTTVFSGRLPGAYRFRYLIVLAAVGYVVAGEERLQRFTTLQDPEFLSERLVGSVNLTFFELAGQYPLGNGLGGGGHQRPALPAVRGFATSSRWRTSTRGSCSSSGCRVWSCGGCSSAGCSRAANIRRTDMFYFGRRLAYVACACCFAMGLLGVGLFTSVPATTLTFLLTGWLVVREVRVAPQETADTATLRRGAGQRGKVECPALLAAQSQGARVTRGLGHRRRGIPRPWRDGPRQRGAGRATSIEARGPRAPRRPRHRRPFSPRPTRRSATTCRARKSAAPLAESLLSRKGLTVAAEVTAAEPGARVIVNGGNCPWPDINWVHAVHACWHVHDEGAPAWLKVKHRAVKAIARRQERAALRLARTVIANSQATKRAVIETGLAEASKVHAVVPRDGLVVGRSDGRRARSSADRLPYPRRRSRRCVRRCPWLRSQQGIRRRLEARGSELVTAGDCRGTLLVAGGGGRLPFWRREATRAGLGDRVRFLGHTARVREVLAAADLLVSPVRYEAYGMNVHEALCRGAAVIVSGAAGIVERFDDDFEDALLPAGRHQRRAGDSHARVVARTSRAGVVARRHWPPHFELDPGTTWQPKSSRS